MRVAFNKEDIPMKMTIGHFLFRRLREIGVSHIFGVPGDFNLQLLEQLSEIDGIDFVGTCNELKRPTPPTATRAPMALRYADDVRRRRSQRDLRAGRRLR